MCCRDSAALAWNQDLAGKSVNADFPGLAKLDLQIVFRVGFPGSIRIEARPREPGSQVIPSVAEEKCRSGEPAHDDLQEYASGAGIEVTQKGVEHHKN